MDSNGSGQSEPEPIRMATCRIFELCDYSSIRKVRLSLSPRVTPIRPPQDLPDRAIVTQFKYATRRHSDRLGLALTRTITVHGRLYAVETGMSQTISLSLLQMFARDLVLLTPGLLFLAAVLGYWMSRKALHPIAELAFRARQINGQSLNVRLPISATKDEVSDLSETLNEMLARIESGVRSIRDFTANAAHELRTPIALIRTEVEVALSFSRSNEEYRDSYANVHQETIRMTGLIDNLLVLARTDAGAEVLRFETIDAAQLVRRMGEKWSACLLQALLEFHIEAGDAPLPMGCDLLSMQRLLNILMENAWRYTPPGGSITLRAIAENERVLLEVRDTGIGIAAQHLPRIFDVSTESIQPQRPTRRLRTRTCSRKMDCGSASCDLNSRESGWGGNPLSSTDRSAAGFKYGSDRETEYGLCVKHPLFDQS